MAFEQLTWDEGPPERLRGAALTIGNFDGVHRGHAALVAEMRRQADVLRAPAVVLTFDPHPLQLLRPERFQPVLTTLADRAELLKATGADAVVVLRTTPVLLQQSAADFFAHVVRQGFQTRALVEGQNFGFGKNREGNVESLRDLCRRADIAFTVVPPCEVGGLAVSSSRVRAALLRGDVAEAAILLGRLYRVRGKVAVGSRRGRTLGFPTANLEGVDVVIPADGVYAVRVWLGENRWAGAANVGPNPTFGERARKIEVHLIGFEGDLYGQSLAVDFVARLRQTRPFAGIGELVEQLRCDVEQAQQLVEQERTA